MTDRPREPVRPGARFDPDALAALEAERDFLLRSIRDLEDEYEAGDLDEADFEALRDEYTARAAVTLRAIRDRRTALDENTPPRSPVRTAVTFVVIVGIASLAGLVISRSIGARGAEDTATGGIGAARSPNQRALDCQAFIDPTDPTEAVACFEGVLEDDPRNVVANTWLAWQLELAAGEDLDPDEARRIEGMLETALAQRPDYSHALAFRAIIAFRHGAFEDAARFLDEFEATDPSPDATAVIESFDLRQRIDDVLGGDPASAAAVACRELIDPQDPIEALRCFQEVLDEHPDNVIANTWLAFQLEQTVEHLPAPEAAQARDRVDEHLDHALEVAPDDPYALAVRVIVAFARDDAELGRGAYERLLETDPPADALALLDDVVGSGWLDDAD